MDIFKLIHLTVYIIGQTPQMTQTNKHIQGETGNKNSNMST